MKNVKKLFSAILFAFALLMVMPAVLPGYSNTETVQAAVKTITLFKGYGTHATKRTLAATNLTWISSDSSVATVEVVSQSNGKTTLQITPVSTGTAYIKYKKPNSSSYVTQYQVNVITSNAASKSIGKKGTYTIKLNGVKDANTIKWSVSNSDIISLSSASKTSVKVTGKAVGSAYVYATVDGAKKYCTRVKVQNVYLSKSSIGLTKGNTYTLSVKNTTQTVTWSSSNTSIATVTSAGKVTAKAKGTAYIYATAGGVKYKCKVSVSNPLTAAEYMAKLKTTISSSSKVNSAGNHYIYYGTKSTTSKYYYYVVYETSKDRLRFIFQRKDIDTTSKRSARINMYIYNPSTSYKATASMSITTPKGVSFVTKRTFDYRTYSNSTDYTYTISSANVSLTASRKTAMQTLSNDYMQTAMKGWNKVLTKNSSSLAKIGFAKY